jgi:hypothetical protein
MKKELLLIGFVAAVALGGGSSTVGAAPRSVTAELAACQAGLNACKADLAALRALPPAPVAQTGATLCGSATGEEIPCAGTGQDGDHQAGVPAPAPRFVDNGNGTIIDRLTGLIWSKHYCAVATWDDGVALVASLSQGNCGLNDNSIAGDWRLPNVAEALSLVSWSGGGIAGGNVFLDYNGQPFREGPMWTSTPSLPSASYGEFGKVFWFVEYGAVRQASIMVRSRGSVSIILPVRSKSD